MWDKKETMFKAKCSLESYGLDPMTSVTLEEAQARLSELLDRLQPGEETTITAHGHPVAQVRRVERTSWPSKAGSYQKSRFWMAPDFDAPLEVFAALVSYCGWLRAPSALPVEAR